MDILERAKQICRQKKAIVAFADGEDIRVLHAAVKLQAENLVHPLIVGRPTHVRELMQKAGLTTTAVQVIDYLNPDLLQANAADYFASRANAKKPCTEEEAIKTMQCPLAATAMLAKRKDIEVGVAGNISSTSDVLRAGIRILGTKAGCSTVSSFFFMIAPDGTPFIFSDAGVIPEPTVDQLVDITVASAEQYTKLMDEQPRVALLSFSTKGSAKHPRVSMMQEVFAKLGNKNLPYAFDGELQFDAAVSPEIAASKAKGSPVGGKANVFIFPSLEAGNIAYKVAQRFGGFTALGPLLQGLDGGWHDLSRGCTAEDIFQVALIGVALERGSVKAKFAA